MSRGWALAGAAVAVVGLATDWRIERASLGTSAVPGVTEFPLLGVVLLGAGLLLLGVSLRVRAVAAGAAVSFLVAGMLALAGFAPDGDATIGPSPWLVLGGCLVAALASVRSTTVREGSRPG